VPARRGIAGLLQVLVMFVVTLVVARPIALLYSSQPSAAIVRGVALLALACVNAGQFVSILWWRGLTPIGYFSSYGAIAEATYALIVAGLALAPLLGIRAGKRRLGFWAMVERSLGSVAIGLFLTFLYHAAGYGLWALFRPSDQSALVQIIAAPGIVLAERGFEAQMAIPILNFLAFFLAFVYLSWLFLARVIRANPR
jgi:hypothetical protein